MSRNSVRNPPALAGGRFKNIRKVKVGEDIYRIVYKKDDKFHGVCDTVSKVIKLDSGLKELGLTAQVETIFHELAHAVASHFDLDAAFQKSKAAEKPFEQAIDFSAKGLLMVMLDNLSLFEWIIKALKKETRKGAPNVKQRHGQGKRKRRPR